MDELGLFPLGIVLLPTERLPLHIFEDRYKELVEECLEQDAEQVVEQIEELTAETKYWAQQQAEEEEAGS